MGSGADQDSVLELLRELGPLDLAELRTRLCIASRARIEAAVMVLATEGRIELCGTTTRPAYRTPGDERPLEVRVFRRRRAGKVMA